MDIINRKTLTVFNQNALNGIMDGCEAVKWPYSTTPTGITTITTSTEANRIYDLSGRMLPEIPKKGFYILNGKKYIK